MKGTQVWSLAWEDSTGGRAAKPESHNYWVQALEPKFCNKRSLHGAAGE